MDGDRSAAARFMFSMTMTNTCGGAGTGVGDGVAVRDGVAADSLGDGDSVVVAAGGGAHERTATATSASASERTRIRTCSHSISLPHLRVTALVRNQLDGASPHARPRARTGTHLPVLAPPGGRPELARCRELQHGGTRSDDPLSGSLSATKIAPGQRPGRSIPVERVERSDLEDDLMPSRRAPPSTAPALWWQRRGPAAADASTDHDLEIGERDAAALLFLDRAKREDRVECGVRIHRYTR